MSRIGHKISLVMPIVFIIITVAVAAFLPASGWAEEPCAIQHPLDPPQKDLAGQCPNCGMARPMWARTWMTFHNSQGVFGVCSFHCLADIAVKSGEDPKEVKVALYVDPQTMIPVEKAFFVVGSKAKGTMTMKSKLAFPSEQEAAKFARACGGQVLGFKGAMEKAKAALAKENPIIAEKRLKTKKIVEPIDNKDQCPVCGMYPARYTQNKCQLVAQDKKRYYFCSMQCLSEFMKDAKKYATVEAKPFLMWVTDYPSGSWISARTGWYVVGSKVQGPMGREAFAFDKKKQAEEFASKEGGQVVSFAHITPDLIKTK